MKDDCMVKGLHFNVNKTKRMVFEREETRTNARITVDDVVLEQVNEFVYLGCVFSRDGRSMNKFEFSKDLPGSAFRGREFYSVYKHAEFLKSSENINRLLHQGYELRQELRKIKPGDTIAISGMWLSTDLPLIIKKTDSSVAIKHFEFSQNRLTGLVAAYAYDNRNKLPNLQSQEAKTLNLTWDCNDADKCKLYLSAVTGAEHFDDQFSYWPLVCAIKKLQLKKIDEKSVLKIAKKKNMMGIPLGTVLKSNFEEATRIWSNLPGDSNFEEFISTISSKFISNVE